MDKEEVRKDGSAVVDTEKKETDGYYVILWIDGKAVCIQGARPLPTAPKG